MSIRDMPLTILPEESVGAHFDATPPPVPYDVHEREISKLIDERDYLEEMCDKLAYCIASEEVLGEHSNGNDPWQNALDYAEYGESN